MGQNQASRTWSISCSSTSSCSEKRENNGLSFPRSPVVDLASAKARCGNVLRTVSRYHIGRDISEDYDLHKTKVLGHGTTSVVKLAHRRTDRKREYAVKCCMKGLLEGENGTGNTLDLIQNEAEVYLTLDHPNIARLYDVYEYENRMIYLVMENCSGGELYQELKSRKTQYFSEPEAAEALTQMLRAVAYLHSQNVVHRDLKLENFLYQDDGRNKSNMATLKLIDFGFAIHWNPSSRMHAKCGTLYYVSPDVLSDSGYTSKCDCWSLGVIAFMLLAGYPPFSGEENTLHQRILVGKADFRENHWDHVTELGRDFTKRLLKKNPKKRLSAQEALNHPWLLNTSRLQPRMPYVSSQGLMSLAAYAEASHLQRVAIQLIAQELSDHEMQGFREAFYSLDVECKGSLRSVDLKNAVRCVQAPQYQRKHGGVDEADAQPKGKDIGSTFLKELTAAELESSLQRRERLADEQVQSASEQGAQKSDCQDAGCSSSMSEKANALQRANSFYLLSLCSMLERKNDDRIEYTDFVAAMISARMSEAEVGHAVLGAFQRFDVDRSGYISTDDIQAMLGDTGALVEEEVKEVTLEADLWYAGSISYDQFAAIARGVASANYTQDAGRTGTRSRPGAVHTRYADGLAALELAERLIS